ncbi:3-keto-5-aminohexanoate cleavage protein [Alphaproteobacteria bacterium LSUCC0684]
MSTLIMAAPNGARKTKADHPNLPITVDEVVAEARACREAGAAMLHAHVRNRDGAHVLDHGLYRELLDAMKRDVPDMLCQITTEAVGVFTPKEQASCLLQVQPAYASVAIREITADQSPSAIDFARNALGDAVASGTRIQYILYDISDLELLRQLHAREMLPDRPLDVLYVLGKYNPGFVSSPEELDPFLAADKGFIRSWMICAFGPEEYDSMLKAAAAGGHARVGFENNLALKDGSTATSSSALVAQLAERLTPKSPAEAARLFA